MTRLKIFFYKLKKIGLLNAVIGMAELVGNQILHLFFHFDKWHIGATYHLKPYKAQVVEIINNLTVTSVTEVGCGLGDIISRVDSLERLGIDPDVQVIKCATFLHGNKCNFYTSDLENSAMIINSSSDEGGIKLIVMINWLHNIEFYQLKKALLKLQSPAHQYFLLMDVIYDEIEGYKYKHSKVSDLGEIIEKYESVDKVRYFVLIELDLG